MLKTTSSTSSFFNLNLTNMNATPAANGNNGSIAGGQVASCSSSSSKNSNTNSTSGMNTNMGIINVESQLPLQSNQPTGLNTSLMSNSGNTGNIF